MGDSTVMTIGYDAFASVIDALSAQINVESVVGILAAIAGGVVGLVFMWWGVRKVTHALMSAFKRGKISL